MKNLKVSFIVKGTEISTSDIFQKFSFFKMIKCGVLISVFALTASFLSCGKTEGNTCGPLTTYDNQNYKVHHTACYDGTLYRDHYYEDVKGTPEDICADEHINTEFDVTLHDLTDIDKIISITAKVYWGGFYEEQLELTRSQDLKRFQGKISNIGLKQAFQDKPGFVGVQLIVRVAGSITLDCTADVDKLNLLIDKMQAKVIYYKEI